MFPNKSKINRIYRPFSFGVDWTEVKPDYGAVRFNEILS